MTEEIIRKLSAEVHKGITTEAQVVYLLAGIRKLIERDGLGEDFSDLKFHCDWVLHSKLEGTLAKLILHVFDRAEAAMRRNNLKFEDLPFDLTWQIDAISKMQVFGKRVTNPGVQVRADQRLGVSWAISESLRRSKPGRTSSI